MAAKKHYVYVKELGTGKVVRKIEVQEKNIYPGYLDKMVTGLMRNMDLDRFCVDDDAVQIEALRREKRRTDSGN